MTSQKLFHLSYAIELDPQGHYVFYLGVKEFVYNNKSYKDRYEKKNKNKKNRSNLNSDITVHRLGYFPKHRKSKYLVYRQGQNFDILPHKFCMTNEISLNEISNDYTGNPEENITKYVLLYKNHSQDDPYYKNPMFLNSIVKEFYDYESNTSIDLPRMTKNVFSLLNRHIPFEDKNLYRFLLSSKIRNSVDSSNLNRELILDLYTMMDGYEDDDFRCLLQEKILNVYNLPAVSQDKMYKHELIQIQKQLHTQEYPIKLFFKSSYLLDDRTDTLQELKRKKDFREKERQKKLEINSSNLPKKSITEIMLMDEDEKEMFKMDFEGMKVLIDIKVNNRKRKREKAGSSSSGSSSSTSIDLTMLYAMLDAEDNTNLNFSDSD